MAHHIYHTEAILLGSRPSGEGDRVLYCYTRELGLVSAHAKSLRLSRSRLRYALQTDVDLISGKYGWKLISARPINSYAALWQHKGKRAVVAEHAQLLRRLIQGEERHELLFDDMLDAFDFLGRITEESKLRSAELLFVIRLLSRLGYWEEYEQHAPLLADNAWANAEELQVLEELRAPLLAGVNRALRATQL
jgi:recombinational DNA repair protein (RecF pathway)